MLNDDGTWFRRFAEIPGVGYRSDDARRARLKHTDVVPKMETYELDGRRVTELLWPDEEDLDMRSPAQAYETGNWLDESSDKIHEDVLNILELPGEAGDYDSVLQHASAVLWQRRREEPRQLARVEWLYLLDLRLIEAHPKIVEFDGRYMMPESLNGLIRMYEREGFLHEAMSTATRFVKLWPDIDERLRERVARLREEHA